MTDLEKFFNEAYHLFQDKRFTDSLSKLADAETYYLEQITTDWRISIENLKGFNYLGLNMPEDAQYCFEGALLLDEKSSQACAGLGEIFFLKREEAKAKTMFEYAVLYNRSNSFAITGLEKVNYLLGLAKNHNTLAEPVELEVEMQPDYKTVISAAGEHFSNNEYRLTVDCIQSVEERIDNDFAELQSLITELSNLKGTAFLSLGELDEARNSFEKALNLTPDSSTACWGLAEIFLRTGMLDEAKTMFEWALNNDPENKAAKEGLETLSRSIANHDAKTEKLKRALKLASGKIIELD